MWEKIDVEIEAIAQSYLNDFVKYSDLKIRQVWDSIPEKLAVGRAIFKNDDVYILDEPDASLDINKQYELMNIYKNIMKNKIGIYVTHKVNYAQYFSDYIYVIDYGIIKEKGTHNELLINSTIYKNLFYKCNNVKI